MADDVLGFFHRLQKNEVLQTILKCLKGGGKRLINCKCKQPSVI